MEEKQRKPAVAGGHAALCLAILSYKQLQIKQHFTFLNGEN